VRVDAAVTVGASKFARKEVAVAVCKLLEVGAAFVGLCWRNWFATGSPKRAEATVLENNTSASTSHCQPASMCERRVR
jgi:hypothetical protein